MPNLSLDALMANRTYMIKLTHASTGQTWTGPISADFSVSASSQYSSPFADSKQGLHDKLMGLQQTWQNMASRLGIEVGSIPIASMKTLLDSVSVWSGTEKPVFSIPITFIATSYKDNVQAKAVKLVSMIYPSTNPGLLQQYTDEIFQKMGGAIGSVTDVKQNKELAKQAAYMRQELVAPGGYAPQGTTAKGTYMLEIGTWFRATELILQDASMELSKERMPNGHALWATVTVTLTPWRLCTQQEYQRYFLTSGGLSGLLGAIQNKVAGTVNNAAGGLLDKATNYISSTELGKSAINAVKTARDYVDQGAKSLNEATGKALDDAGNAINKFLE